MLKKYLVRRIFVSFLAIIIPCVLLVSFFFAYTNRLLRDQVEADANQSLRVLEENLMLTLDSVSYQQELLSSNPRLTLALQKLLRQESISYTESTLLNVMNALLSSNANTKNYIASIYIYLDSCEQMLSTNNGMKRADEMDDNSWLDIYKETDAAQDRWLSKREYIASPIVPSSQVISIFLRLTNSRGVIVINITPSRFSEILNHVDAKEESLLYILNAQSEVLFSNNAGSDAQDSLIGSGLLRASDDTDNQWIQFNGEKYIYQTLPLESYNLTLISMTRYSLVYQMPNSFFSFFIMLISAFSLLILLQAYITTHRNFKQIYSILDVFENGSQAMPPSRLLQNEYDVILQNIVNMYARGNELKMSLAQRETQQAKAEMTALQMQINPHFLFNTLQTLDMEALAELGRDNVISSVIGELSDLLLYVLGSPQQSVTLADELLYLRTYINIQNYRYNNRFTVRYDIDENALSVQVLRLMLQPIVENSLYHGVGPLQRKGVILIKIHIRDNRLYFRVIDNGIGMKPQQLAALRVRLGEENGDGIGLININRRLIIRYGQASELRIASISGRGTVVSFSVPLPE